MSRGGYVFFTDRNTFDTDHALAIAYNGLPRVGRGFDGRKKSFGIGTIDVINTDYLMTNQVNARDDRVLAFIEQKWWPPALYNTYTLYNSDDVELQEFLVNDNL